MATNFTQETEEGRGNRHTVPHCATEQSEVGQIMGSVFCSTRGAGGGGHALEVPQITLIQPSPLLVEEGAFTLPTQVVNPGNEPDLLSARDHDDERSSDGSEEGSSPRSSRKHFLELMVSSSSQVRRSLKHRNSAHLSSDSDTSSLDGERSPVTLDLVEHEWMISASDAEWAGLEHLLTSEPKLLLKKDFVSGFTCLHWAAKHDKPEVIALIVNFAKRNNVRLDVNVRSSSGYTPLHVAAMQGHMEVVKLLVGAYCADVDVRDYSGRKACQYLAGNTSLDIQDIIGAYDYSQKENKGQIKGRRWRLSKVFQPNVKDPNSSDSDSVDGESQKALRRKPSFAKLKPSLEKLRRRTSQLVHSASFRDNEDMDRSSRRGSFIKRKTQIFG